jgi:DNA-binding CsgD family transcriptional regulator
MESLQSSPEDDERAADPPNRGWSIARSDLIEQLGNEQEEVDFADFAAKLRKVVPHRFFAYGVFRISDGRVERLINVDFPVADLRSVGLQENLDCEIIREWLVKREPLLVTRARTDALFVAHAVPAAVAGPNVLVFHAQLDLAGSRAIAFCLGDVPVESFELTGQELRVLTPYLYAAAVRQMRAITGRKLRYSKYDPLTPREIEVLKWVYHGKTNEEIGEILGISVFTVKNHIQRILLKLNATNRVQAVLRALEAGLIQHG